jgi:hypothetical protein
MGDPRQHRSLARSCAARAISFSLGVALVLAAATRPAHAAPLTTRLDLRAAGAPGSQPRVEWYQWAPRPPKSTGKDIVVGQENRRGPISLIILGAGVVAGGGGVYFGLKNQSAKSDYNSAQTAAARTDAQSRASSAATKANISWIACGLLVATGLGVLFFTDL